MGRPHIDIRIHSEVNAGIDNIIALLDQSLENLIKYACLSCIDKTAPRLRGMAQGARIIALDLYALYSQFIPWLLVDELRACRGSCIVPRGLECSSVSIDCSGREVSVIVRCSEISYECRLSVGEQAVRLSVS